MLRRFLPYGARAATVRAGCPLRSARSRCRHRTVVRDDRSGVSEGAAHTIRPHTRDADDCPGTPEAARQTCALRDCRFAAAAPSKSYDAVVSALALHHLPDSGKRHLFADIFKYLTSGGVFINADQVGGETPRLSISARARCGSSAHAS